MDVIPERPIVTNALEGLDLQNAVANYHCVAAQLGVDDLSHVHVSLCKV